MQEARQEMGNNTLRVADSHGDGSKTSWNKNSLGKRIDDRDALTAHMAILEDLADLEGTVTGAFANGG